MPTTEERLASLEARVDRVNDLFALVSELRGDMNRRFDATDQKIDRDFRAMVGIQIALLLAVVGALLSAYYR